MSIENLSTPSADNLEIYVDADSQAHRISVCESCQFFAPGGYKAVEIIDAITGLPTNITTYVYEDCTVDNTAVNAFTSLKISVCPEGKW